MEHAAAQYGRCGAGQLDHRRRLGHILDSAKDTFAGWHTNVDTLDIAPFSCGPADEFLLEGIDADCICLCAGVGFVEDIFNVNRRIMFAESITSLKKQAFSPSLPLAVERVDERSDVGVSKRSAFMVVICFKLTTLIAKPL